MTTYSNGAPASLPSDYFIVERYAAHNQPGQTPTTDGTLPVLRRQRTLSGGNYRPRNLTKAQIRERLVLKPTERTPLLATSPIPRIEQPVGRHDGQEETASVMFREEMRILFKFTVPVYGSLLFEYSLIIASVVSIGHISTSALAGITLGSMTASVTGFSILQGLASALDTLLPSAWTGPQPHMVGLWSQRMIVIMAATLIPICAIWLNAEAILLLLRQEPEVAKLASIYLRWMVLSLPAYAFNLCSRRYFQSQGLFAVPTQIIIMVAPINIALNYLLVWGPQTIRLGFIGAPIATVASFNLISLLSLCYGIFFVRDKRAWHPLSMRMFASLGAILKLGIGGVGQYASEWWSWELIALAASLLGPVSLASQSIVLTSSSTAFQAPYALAVATSVRIGNLLGEENARRAKVAANTSVFMALVLSGFFCALFMVFRKNWARLFNDDEDVVEMVATILPLVALFQVFDSVSEVTGGILRTRGKQLLGALLNLSAYYVIGIPIGAYLAFRLELGLLGLWMGLTLSLVYSAAWGVWLCLMKTDWEKEVMKVKEREEIERKAAVVAGFYPGERGDVERGDD